MTATRDPENCCNSSLYTKFLVITGTPSGRHRPAHRTLTVSFILFAESNRLLVLRIQSLVSIKRIASATRPQSYLSKSITMMQKSLRTTASSTGRIPCSNLNSTPVRLISTPHKQASHVCSNASSENATSSSDQCQSSRRAALICLTGSAALLQSQFQGAQALG